VERNPLGNPLTRLAQYVFTVLKGMWREDGSLSQKTVRAGLWTYASMFFRRGLGFVQTVILVHLVAPGDYGLMAIAGVVLEMFDVFTRTGMNQALIQRHEVGRETLDTVWTIQVTRSVMLCAAIFFSAPFAASFYGNPQLTWVLRVIAIRFLIAGFGNIGVTLLQKELDFKRTEILVMVTQSLSITTTVVCGLLLRNVWALIIGQLAQQTLSTAGGYLVHPYRPSLRFHLERARSLFHFGVNVTASTILFFIADSGSQAFLGKALNITELGFYYLAMQLSNLPVSCFSNVISGVTPSTYAKLQDDSRRLSKALFSILGLVAALSIPASLGMCLLMPDFLRLYGPKYSHIVGCARLLTLYAVLTAAAESLPPFFLSTGRPRMHLNFNLIRCALLVGTIYPLTCLWGITGAALAAVISIGGCAIWAFASVGEILGREALLRWLGDLGRIMASAAVMGVAVFVLQLGGVCSSPVGFVAAVVCGAAIYFGMLCIVSPNTVADLRNLFSKAAA
jgi:O-antigen/teichoic acid export membrane protein